MRHLRRIGYDGRMKKIVMLSLPPAHGVDVMGPLEVFGLASRMLEEESGRPGYETELVTNSADLVIPTSSGIRINAHKHYEQVTGKVDTLFIAAGAGTREPGDPALLAWLREMAGSTRRVCSVLPAVGARTVRPSHGRNHNYGMAGPKDK